MKTIHDYLNDPSLADEPQSLREVHAARLKVQDETRGMTSEEQRIYFHDGTLAILAEYGITPQYADFSPAAAAVK
jgi:hypothetical protein